MCFSTKSDFFVIGEKYAFRHDSEKISFSVPSIDHRGKTFTVSKLNAYGWKQIGIQCDNLPVGKFYFDQDESNEDRVVIYLDQKEQ